jgi:large subunit ribosomal protein L9
MKIILMERIEKLGQMGDIVTVRDGYARNFLLPKGKALRASKGNMVQFEQKKAQYEAQNLVQRGEAEGLAERMDGVAVVLIRQASDSGQLYGSVNTRDIAVAVTESGFTIDRHQVILGRPIKSLGVQEVSLQLHPEVSVVARVNVARSEDEAAAQAAGRRIGGFDDDDEFDTLQAAEEYFENSDDIPVDDDETGEEEAEQLPQEDKITP